MNTRFFKGAATILLVLAAVACGKGEGKACFKATECDEGLACVGDALKRCEKCEGSDMCAEDGLCAAKEGLCVPGSEEDCKKAYICTGKGGCTLKEGKCTVGGDADCQQSEACKTDGFCKAKGNNCIREKKPEKKEEEKEEKKEEEKKEG